VLESTGKCASKVRCVTCSSTGFLVLIDKCQMEQSHTHLLTNTHTACGTQPVVCPTATRKQSSSSSRRANRAPVCHADPPRRPAAITPSEEEDDPDYYSGEGRGYLFGTEFRTSVDFGWCVGLLASLLPTAAAAKQACKQKPQWCFVTWKEGSPSCPSRSLQARTPVSALRKSAPGTRRAHPLLCWVSHWLCGGQCASSVCTGLAVKQCYTR